MQHGIKTSQNFKKDSLKKLNGNWPIAILTCIITFVLSLSFLQSLYNINTLINDTFPNTNIFNFYRRILEPFSPLITWYTNNIYLLLISLIMNGPLSLGICRVFLKITREEHPCIKDLFFAYTNIKYFFNSILLYILSTLFTILWSLLFIIPGIIAALRYNLAFYIMCNDPNISPMTALEKSSELMDGNKERLFTLYISFIGWDILSLFTLYLPNIFVKPYFNTAHSEFYYELIQ